MKSRQKSKEFSSLLFTVIHSLYFFKLAQPLTVSEKEKGGKPDIKPYPLPYGLRNPYKITLKIIPKNLNVIVRL